MNIYNLGPYIGFVYLGLLCAAACFTGWLVERWANRRWLRSVVHSNLDAAWGAGQFEADGYCAGLDAFELAADLTCYAEDCYDLNARKLVPYVRDWLFQKGIPCKG